MGLDNLDTRGNILSGVLIIILSGIIFGIGALFVKLAISQADFFAIITYPISWLAVIFAIVGFVFMQKAMHEEYVSIIVPMVTGIVTLISVMLAFVFLNETITATRWIGVLLILVGSFIICMVKRK
jgi:uncharacterized membrane protein